MMKKRCNREAPGKRYAAAGAALCAVFALWTVLIRTVDVRPLGVQGTDIGFAALNVRFHRLTGVHMVLYTITDWMGLVPVMVCLVFAGIGLYQLIRRRSLLRVDADILILGGYYLVVILAYLIFEMIPVNYRPVLIDGTAEASYPSSTTLLVLSVMLPLAEQTRRRVPRAAVGRVIIGAAAGFSVFTVVGRLVCGVHWFTDIVGGVLLSAGLFMLYRAAVVSALVSREEKNLGIS